MLKITGKCSLAQLHELHEIRARFRDMQNRSACPGMSDSLRLNAGSPKILRVRSGHKAANYGVLSSAL